MTKEPNFVNTRGTMVPTVVGTKDLTTGFTMDLDLTADMAGTTVPTVAGTKDLTAVRTASLATPSLKEVLLASALANPTSRLRAKDHVI